MGYDNMSHRREPRHMDKHREATAQKLLHRKRQSKSSIPVVAVADLTPAPPRNAKEAISPYMQGGRTRRRGFWTVKPCRICGRHFELRQHPMKKENHRCTCSIKCSNENHRRNCLKSSAKYRAANREKCNDATYDWACRNPEKIKSKGHAYYLKKKQERINKNATD